MIIKFGKRLSILKLVRMTNLTDQIPSCLLLTGVAAITCWTSQKYLMEDASTTQAFTGRTDSSIVDYPLGIFLELMVGLSHHLPTLTC
jgi:hypothetical protein